MSGRTTATLGEIFEIARGGSPRPIQDYLTDDADGVNWISIADASASDKYIYSTKKRIKPSGVSRSRMVKPGDFLLTNSMSFGRPYIMKTAGCIHDGWLVLSSKGDNVDQDYFYYLLGSDATYAKFTRLAAGATVKNLNIDLVSGVEVEFPPLPEQRRIAAILDQAEALRTQRRAALAQLDSLTQSLFLDMFGDPVTNPKGWPKQPVGCLGKVHTGKTPPSQNAEYFEGQIPFVTPGDLDCGLESTSRSLSKSGAAFCTVVRAGSALVGCIGNIGKIGKAREPSTFNQQINAIEWSNTVDDDFGIAALRHAKPQMIALSSSTTLPILNKSNFSKVEIVAPPLPLQQTFATRVQAIEALKTQHRAALAELDALFASLQQRAFAGTL